MGRSSISALIVIRPWNVSRAKSECSVFGGTRQASCDHTRFGTFTHKILVLSACGRLIVNYLTAANDSTCGQHSVPLLPIGWLRGKGKGVRWVREGRGKNCWGRIWFSPAPPALHLDLLHLFKTITQYIPAFKTPARNCQPSLRISTLFPCPSNPSASAIATIAFASPRNPSASYFTTLDRFKNSYTLIPLENRAVVFVGKQ
jgi:hypothetical protein